jgi:hypothetical protein
MRFQDPLEITCSACGRMAMVHVRSLLQLEATCPVCLKSLRDIGLSMRASCDKAATVFGAVQIIMQIEDDQGLKIPDAVVEQIKSWEELTIRNLVEAARRSLVADCRLPHESEMMVTSAIKSQFPSSPDILDFDVPLLDAIAPGRNYGDSYQ